MTALDPSETRAPEVAPPPPPVGAPPCVDPLHDPVPKSFSKPAHGPAVEPATGSPVGSPADATNGAGTAPDGRRPGPLFSLGEIALLYGWFFFTVWVVFPLRDRTLSNGAALVLPLLLLASHLLHRDPLSRIGLRFDTFGPCLRESTLLFGPVALALIAYGIWFGPAKSWAGFLRSCAGYPFWGLFQQWAFQSFCHQRLLEVTGRPRLAAILTAGLFGLAHVPNWELTAATLAGGAAFAYLFQKHRNLLPLALWHGWVASGFSQILPRTVFHGLRIGPGAWF